VPVIIWINGGFGAGKTTLAEELHRRLPDAVVYNPEDVGLMLWKWMRPNDDFQHGLAEAGEEVLHVFLEADAGVLRERINARVGIPANRGANQSAREWALSRVDAAVTAATRQPGGTLLLRSDRLTPAELADEVLAAAGQ
jgi:predicted kinase